MSPSLPAAATWYDVAPRLGCQLTSAVLFSHSKEALTFVGAQGADRKGKKGEGFVCWQTSWAMYVQTHIKHQAMDHSGLTSLYARHSRIAAVAVPSHRNDLNIIRVAAPQGKQVAVSSLAAAAGCCVVSWVSFYIETVPAQCLIPAHKGNAGFTGIFVSHVYRGAGC